ncbi:MAG: ATP-binding protein [Deltaproteobacteria bacterium]|uniref:ATP-binding protein n=1 Tax=Desulfobacula sp. TaxID=2593537 RepID=UPI001985D2B0|nr:ATP-binding protein [Candidatus Desulfobacula maris]MBL6995483.1 ATP-binding protein [Desulfobacula sp.]
MKQILKTIIKDFHLKPLPPFKPRHLAVPLDLDKIITIIGPRRAGKTWYLFQLMASLQKLDIKREQILYLNFEDERLDLDTGYDQILDAYLELYPDQKLDELYIFFDEIQEIPDWEKYVRRLYDTISRKIFLTGSNAKMLSKEIASSLRGRSLSFEIMPLSFSEFLSFKRIDSKDTDSTKNRAKIQNSFEEYLTWGGYPELVDMETRYKANILQEYFNVMLYRDLMDRYEIRDASILKYLIKRLIGSFTKEFSINKLYNDLKSRGIRIGKDSIYRLMDRIFSVYMVTYVEKYDPAVVKREMSNKKIYLYDNGIASAIRYAFSEDRGKFLENIIFTGIRSTTEAVFFLKNGYECDFAVFPETDKPILIQVTQTLSQDNLSREINGLEKAGKKIKNSRRLLIAGEVSVPSDSLPKWVEVKTAYEWLLECNGNNPGLTPGKNL